LEHTDLLKTIAEKKKIDGQMDEEISKVLKEFNQIYTEEKED
jgi:hypothetical protein